MRKLKSVLIFLCAIILVACDSPEIKEAKNEVAEAMRDPSSAEFRNVKSFKVNTSTMVCGEVNGKNGFGAMAGYNYFLYISPLIRVAKNSKESQSIYQCCKHLQKSLSTNGAESTKNIQECSEIEPQLLFI
jgi:hypothetical protein